MRKANRESIYCDGIENITDASLVYTNELLEKVQKAFNISLPKYIHFSDIDKTAEFIIKNIIEPFSPLKRS